MPFYQEQQKPNCILCIVSPSLFLQRWTCLPVRQCHPTVLTILNGFGVCLMISAHRCLLSFCLSYQLSFVVVAAAAAVMKWLTRTTYTWKGLRWHRVWPMRGEQETKWSSPGTQFTLSPFSFTPSAQGTVSVWGIIAIPVQLALITFKLYNEWRMPQWCKDRVTHSPSQNR